MSTPADQLLESIESDYPDDDGGIAGPDPTPEPAAAAPAEPPATPPNAAATPPAPAPAEPSADAGRTIPLAAHLEERNRLKAQIAELESRANQTTAVQQKIQALESELAALKNPPKPPEPEPDFAEDPKAYIDRANAKVLDAVRSLEKQGGEQLTAQREQLQQVQLVNAVVASEDAFRATTPDYEDARLYVRNLRANQLALIPGATQDSIVQQIYAEERQMAAQLLQRNINPAQYLYQFAKASGYAGKAAAAPAPAAPAAPAQPAAPAVDKEALRGLGASGGGEPPPDDDDDTDGDPVAALESVQRAFMGRR